MARKIDEGDIYAMRKSYSKRLKEKDDALTEERAKMLTAGRRAGYAASMSERSNPYRDTHDHYNPIGGHGSRTYSEQFTEPGDGVRGFNAEEDALIRERDRLDPYGKKTEKMRVQDAARSRITEEWRRRGRK